MADKPKRLKKHISFSKHEKDIHDYLDGLDNASALIKRLVYNHMIAEQGIAVPVPKIVIAPPATPPNDSSDEESEVSQGADQEKEPEEQVVNLTPEEVENQELAIALGL